MKIAFTICSNNYLSLARVLGKSLLKHNPEYHFIIGLVDQKSAAAEAYYKDFDILPCGDIGLPELEDMANHYSIAEFNTSVKPFYFQYLHKTYPQATQILFVDPDMKVYGKLTDLDIHHQQYDIVLTPHILEPMVDDGKSPDEASYLATGTYNLGFLSLKMSEESLRFLNWWGERLKKYCLFDFGRGLFVDQKWVNLVPVFFNSVYILRHPGYNIAYWNIQERHISGEPGNITVNQQYPLIIYHWSSVGIKQNKLFYKQQNRYADTDFPLVYRLFQEYVEDVKTEGYLQTNPLPCYYLNFHDEFEKRTLKQSFAGRIKLLFKQLVPAKTRQKIKQKLIGSLGN